MTAIIRFLVASAVLVTAAALSLQQARAGETAWETPEQGAPYFVSRWSMSIQASPHEEVIDGEPYIVAEAAAALDDLVIAADGSYRWAMDGTVYAGVWREARDDELHLDKRPGVVLTKARDGSDWIVTETAGACSVKNGNADKAWCEKWVGGMSAVDEINLRPVGWGAPSFEGKRMAPH